MTLPPIMYNYFIGQQVTECDLESEVVKYLGHEIKFTIDQVGLDLINEAAAGSGAADAPTTWDATLRNGEPWINKQVPSYSNVCRKAA